VTTTSRCLAALSLAILPLAAHAELAWHWEDPFSTAEQARLTEWLSTVHESVERAVAPFPFDVHVHFHRADGARSPVPWANTRRSGQQGINVHVDPRYPRDDLLADWTAYHELAHLYLPYLGRRNSWFAEGYASFLQYPLMVAAGVMSEAEMQSAYSRKIRTVAVNYDLPDLTFIDAVPVLRARREYPTAYWGGAIYFLNVDAELRRDGKTVIDVLRQFVMCCRQGRYGLDSLVEELDRIAEHDAFSRQLTEFRTRKGFPDYPDT